MINNKYLKKVPELRFKEFSGEWDTKPYGEIYKFYSTNSLSREKLNYQSGEVYNIHYGDIHKKFSTMFNLENENVPFINSDVDLSKIKEENYCQVGDLVIADASEDYIDIGKTIEIISLNGKKTLSGLHTFLARPNKEYVALGFVGYMLQNYTVRKQIMKIAQGTKVLSLSTGRLSNIILNLPQKPEQQKIASFLTTIDTKIKKLTKKVELQEQYKKGVMQKIFNQEIRFKKDDGSEFEEWKEKKLNQLLFEPKKRNFEKKFNKNDVLSVSGNFGIVNQIEFQGRSFAGASVDNYHIVEIDDIVYTKSPLKSNPYGIIKVNKHKAGIVSTLYAVYRPKENLNSIYLDYYFQLDDNTNRYLRPLVHKGAKNDMKINNSHVLSDFITIPEKEEQDKIVLFFIVLDEKIKQTKIQLAKIKEFKKGLLQRMFV